MTTKALIKGCIQRKSKCQKELVLRFSPMLLTVARRYCSNRLSPEDILQEALINILNNIEQFDPKKGNLEGWMRRIVINLALRKQERKYFSNELFIQEELTEPAIDAAIYEKLDAEDLMKTIDETLPDAYRKIFYLAVVDGYGHQEIAELMGITSSTSRSKLTRAKKLLRLKLTEQKLLHNAG